MERLKQKQAATDQPQNETFLSKKIFGNCIEILSEILDSLPACLYIEETYAPVYVAKLLIYH